MKIAHKISLSFFISGIILTVCSLAVIYYGVKTTFLNAIYTQLEMASQAKAQHIKTYLEMLKVSTGQFSKSVVLEDYLRALRDNPNKSQQAFEIAMRRLNRTKEVNPEIFEFLLINSSGKIVASTNKDSIGENKSTDAFFVEARNSSYIKDAYYQEKLTERLLAVSAPILDSQTNEFIGVMVARVRLDELDKIVTAQINLRKTAEVYLVNKNGYMITPSRFLKDTFLKQKIDTSNYKTCLSQCKQTEKHEKKHIIIAPNYRGERTLGTHAYIPEMQWCLLAEIEEEEALAPLFAINLILGIILVVVPISSYLSGVFFAKLITGPIHKLHEGTEIIGGGNLDYKVGTKSKDEIGQLSRAFDMMTDSLKQTTTSIDKLNEEIAERKKAEAALRESETRYRTLYNSSADAIMILDPESNKFIAANPATLRLFGCSSEEDFTAFSPGTLSPDFQPDSVPSTLKAKQMVELAIKEGSNFFQWVHKRKDGSEFFATVLLSRMQLGEKTVLQATVRDITLFKKAEEELKKVIALKEDFISIVSHELRTPLGPIKEGVRIILDGITGPVNDDQRDLLSTVERSANRLNRLINNVLDFQKLQAGKMSFNLQDNDIVELINEVHKAMLLLTKPKGLDFTVEYGQDLPKIKFDKDRIMQVLNNLINNAIKFTEQGNIKIIAKKESSAIHVIVEDSGPGIKKEDMPKLFRSFQQLDLAKEKGLGGTGLGLAISKEIILQHKGKIWVESEPGKGASFQFTLPIK